ncbi:MAG: spermine synthase [Opitutaceae bacterium]|nr:spermine synthase [Opitutaceae bacterium]|tara:strand:+ start:98 stop:772 length:675 start_codon:yes stop_codon:yes gene_type:complete
MKPHIKLAETITSDGAKMALFEHDGDYSLSMDGQVFMRSKLSASEKLLGEVGVARLDTTAECRVLIGGLGLGFTLAKTFKASGPKTTIEVVEFTAEVVDWNREYLKPLNGTLLDDQRVEVVIKDVTCVIRKSKPGTYNAILLDVDNGPVSMVTKGNFSLYSNNGIRAIRAALKSNGRAVFWSAGTDPLFVERLRRNGFRVIPTPAKVHEGAKRAAYMLYVADKA